MNDVMVEAIDLRYVLLEHYKVLGFSEQQVLVLMMMEHLSKQNNRLITAELLSLKMALPLDQIDQIMVGLLQRQLIEFVTENGQTFTSLKPLKQLLYHRFQQALLKQTQPSLQPQDQSIFQIVEKAFARTLSPLEISRIQDWLNEGYAPTVIEEALSEAVKKQKKSIRFMDKHLQKLTAKENFAQEGKVMIGDSPQDLPKTMRHLANQLDDETKRSK